MGECLMGRNGHPDNIVSSGTYRSVTVNTQGHVVGGSNPTTLSGYGITDATPSSHIGTGGASHANATTSVDGFMSAADKAKLNAIAASANNYSHPNSGVTASTYRSVTVNAAGHVTAGTNPTTLSGYGITDAAPLAHIGMGGIAHANATTALDGFMSAADKAKLNAIAASANNYTHPNSGVIASTYRSVTVNAAGHVTAGTNPTSLAGYGITDAISSLNPSSNGTFTHGDRKINSVIGHASISFGINNAASGSYSFIVGKNNTVNGDCSIAEGENNSVTGNHSTVNGYGNTNNGDVSHVEGTANILGGGFNTYVTGNANNVKCTNSIVVGTGNKTSGTAILDNIVMVGTDGIAGANNVFVGGYGCEARAISAHAEGDMTIAAGVYSHAEGGSTYAEGQQSHAEGEETQAIGNASHTEGSYTVARGRAAHAEGTNTNATGNSSHAEGDYTNATDFAAHAEGYETYATGEYSHAEGGYSSAEADGAHAEGYETMASGMYSHSEGYSTSAMGLASHSSGYSTTARTSYSYVNGVANASNNIAQTVIGKWASTTAQSGTMANQIGDVFVIGNGTENGTTSSSSNAFRVTYGGVVYSKGAYNTSGADYAEYFEWIDGNPDNEDRRGHFVTIDGEKIKIADSSSDYILGIVSGNPCIIGNSDEDWNGRWLKDEFGSYVIEHFDEEETIIITDEETKKPITVKTGNIVKSYKYKENPEYDPSLSYVERKDRKEWSAIGMLGVLSVRDNGECKVNSFCTVGENGIAIPSTDRRDYRVISRISDNIIKIVLK